MPSRPATIFWSGSGCMQWGLSVGRMLQRLCGQKSGLQDHSIFRESRWGCGAVKVLETPAPGLGLQGRPVNSGASLVTSLCLQSQVTTVSLEDGRTLLPQLIILLLLVEVILMRELRQEQVSLGTCASQPLTLRGSACLDVSPRTPSSGESCEYGKVVIMADCNHTLRWGLQSATSSRMIQRH